MQADTDFSWWRERNPHDYVEWGPPLPTSGPPSFHDVIALGREPRIKAKGVCLERYQPLKEFPDLYARFAKLQTQADAAKFIRTFGPLTDSGLQGGDGDSLRTVLSQASNIRDGHLYPSFGFVVTSLNARLTADHDGIHLKVEPPDLLAALWLQFAQAVAKGLANRCKQCDGLFATGPDTKRRRGAEFCSIECKTKYHSLQRSRR
jgi:hypothetical protein